MLESFDLQLASRLLDWGILGVGVKYLSSISGNLSKLNEKIAVLYERSDSHDKTLERHDDRISRVERHCPSVKK